MCIRATTLSTLSWPNVLAMSVELRFDDLTKTGSEDGSRILDKLVSKWTVNG